MNRSKAKFIAASASGSNGGQCVEVAVVPGSESATPVKAGEPSVVLVRDSKDPDGPALNFTFAEWNAFLDGVVKGEFTTDRLLAQLSTAAN